MEDKHFYHFKRSSASPTVATNSEVFYVCDQDSRWDDVMRQFAAFLDTCGYVGVYESIDAMLDDYWEGK